MADKEPRKSRAQERREKAAEKKKADREMAYFPFPEEFIDVEGDDWRARVPGGLSEPLDMREVLRVSARGMPVKDAGDADRSLDVLEAIGDETGGWYIAMTWSEWEWFQSQLREYAHTIWAAPDSAFLRRQLGKMVTKEQPAKPDWYAEEEAAEAEEAAAAAAETDEEKAA